MIFELSSENDDDFQEAVMAVDELLSEVFDKVPSAIIILDERGTISKANLSASEMLGEPSLEGRKWYEVINAVFRPRKDDGQEISTRDGKRLQVLTKPLSHGQLVQMNDLTATRELSDKLSHMERLSSLGRMAASLAHQIRTPLSAAILYGANLANPRLNPQSRMLFQKKLMSRLEALEAQVSDILMYARSDAQSVSELEAVDLVEDCVQSVQSLIVKAGAQLDTELGDRPMTILGNTAALSGALTNLVANAVEAGAKKVKITLRREAEDVVIEVANNGPAIANDLKQKIFEPFYTTKSNGTGLGLAVVCAVARVHHGRLELHESNEYPVIFSLRIPRSVKPVEQVPIQAA